MYKPSDAIQHGTTSSSSVPSKDPMTLDRKYTSGLALAFKIRQRPLMEARRGHCGPTNTLMSGTLNELSYYMVVPLVVCMCVFHVYRSVDMQSNRIERNSVRLLQSATVVVVVV